MGTAAPGIGKPHSSAITSAIPCIPDRSHSAQQGLTHAVADGRVQAAIHDHSLRRALFSPGCLQHPCRDRIRVRRDTPSPRAGWELDSRLLISTGSPNESISSVSSRNPASSRPLRFGATTFRIVASPSLVRKTGSRPAAPAVGHSHTVTPCDLSCVQNQADRHRFGYLANGAKAGRHRRGRETLR